MRVKTKPFLQREAAECGAACLGIILRYYGREVSLMELRSQCGVSRDGTNAGRIVKTAREYGLEAKGGQSTVEYLEYADLPVILFWKFNHFLVLEGLERKFAYLNDPAFGRRKVSREEFAQSYSGIVLQMQPGEWFVKGGKKRNFLAYLAVRLQHSKTAVAFTFIGGFFLSLIRLIVPVFSLIFVDQILVEGFQDWLRPLLVGMAVTSIVQFMMARMQYIFLRKLIIKLSITMNSKFMWHTLRLPMKFYAQRLAGDLSSRAGLNDQTVQLLSSIANTLIDTVMLVFYGFLMSFYNGILTSVTISFGLINILAVYWIRQFRIEASLVLGEDQGKLSGTILNSLLGIETAKAGAFESHLFSRIAGLYAKVINEKQKLALQTQFLNLLPTFLSALSSTIILVLGGLQVMEGRISIGMLVAYQSIASGFLSPISKLVNWASTLQELEASLERLDDVLDHPIDEEIEITEEVEENSTSSFNYAPLNGKVELSNITFGYNSLKPPLIKNFNLLIKPGARIALVGKSGSGKSTIANLVCGLYQANSGKVLFDDIPRQQIPRSVLAKSVAMVAQDIFLFEGTIRDNLTLWNPTITDVALIQACQDANIHDFIMTLPGSYDATLLEGGVNLSGGQRQRLEIARALVNNPRILILDEATSGLDAETERIIDYNLRRRGCACIVVAHRLSTIRDCDEIIVLSEGKVLERGNHKELWEQGTFYRQLLEANEVSNISDRVTHTFSQKKFTVNQERNTQNISVAENAIATNQSDANNSLTYLEKNADCYLLDGNQPLIFEDLQIIWLVKYGAVEIFYSLAEAGELIGNRHYLFTVKEGELIFNCEPQAKGKLLGIAFEEAELIKVTWADVTNNLSRALVNKWLNHLKTAYYSLQSFEQMFAESQKPSFSPLNWTNIELNLQENWPKMIVINNQFCDYLNHVILTQQEIEMSHTQKLKAYNQHSQAETMSNFASLLYNQETINSITSNFDDLLLMAMGAVGRASKIEIQAPSARVERLHDTLLQKNSLDYYQAYLQEIVRVSRCRMREVKLRNQWWQNEYGPLLGWIELDNTPVALLPHKQKYILYNPKTQTYTPVNSKSAATLSTTATTFYRFFPLEIKNIFQISLFSIKGYEWDIVKIFVLGIVTSLMGMLTPQASAILVNNAIPDSDRLLLRQIALGLFAVALGKSLFSLLQGIVSLRVSTGLESNLQSGIYDRIFRLSPNVFRKFSTGDLLTRIAAISQISALINSATSTTILTSLFSMLNLGLMFVYSKQLTLIVIIVSLINFLISFVSGVILIRLDRTQEGLSGKIQGFTVQLINGVQKLRVAAAESRGFAAWGKKYQPQIQLNNRIFQINDILSVTNEVVSLVTSILIYWFTIQIIISAQQSGVPSLNTGTFIAFNSAMGVFLGGVTSLSNTITNIIGIVPLWERAKSILKSPIEYNHNQAHPGELLGGITLENVTFSYHHQSEKLTRGLLDKTIPETNTSIVLHDISLEVKPGEFVAIVGPSGSGKSTLFRLLLGFEQPQTGKIFYDGKNLAQLDLEALRQQLGIVLQNGKVVVGSIYDNISCGGLVDTERTWEAARQAALADDIEQMPMMMHTMVSEGGNNISVGQRQRLLIARALIRRPKILLFDEATSALDNQTQALVTHSLEQLNVTRIIIAHRLSTILNADRIYVISQGRIVQTGTFSELMQQDGLFRQLAFRQLA